MADVVHRTTKQHRRSVNTPDFPITDWIINPDLGAVAGIPSKYWDISGDVISPMAQPARDQVDVLETAARTSADQQENKSRLDDERVLKAIVAVLLPCTPSM